MIESLLFGVRPLPIVRGYVYVPSLRQEVEIPFCLDTGSTWTVLHPRDTRKFGIYASLSRLRPNSIQVSGIGGNVTCLLVNVRLTLTHTSGKPTYFNLKVAVAPPLPHNRGYPSLLGMDVLSCGTLTVDSTERRVRFDVRQGDTYDISTPRWTRGR